MRKNAILIGSKPFKDRSGRKGKAVNSRIVLKVMRGDSQTKEVVF